MAKKTQPSAAPRELPTLPDAGTRAELSPREWQYLRLETRGEAVKFKVSKEFIEAQKESARSEAKSKPVTEPPLWTQRLIADKKSGFREIVQEAARRALRSPNEETLREVYAVLNEVGRDPKGTEEIASVLTQENLDKILK